MTTGPSTFLKASVAHAPLGTPEHGLGKIDPDQPRPPVEHWQFEASADANIEHTPSETVGGRSGGFASGPQDQRRRQDHRSAPTAHRIS